MRTVIQRVSSAGVKINNSEERGIGPGLLILVGIEESDGQEDIDWLAGKIARLRIFNDIEDIMNLPITELGGEIMIISQFTLHASTRKGNRPSYIRAAKPETAIPLYKAFIERIFIETGILPVSGIFGANMSVSLVNEGPVTIIIDTKIKE